MISERNLENSSLIKGNSSSYQSTPSRITPSIPSFLLAVILCEILAFIFIPMIAFLVRVGLNVVGPITFLYNAMPVAGPLFLLQFMEKFKRENPIASPQARL